MFERLLVRLVKIYLDVVRANDRQQGLPQLLL
jgi:hypothetical protein